MRKMYTKEQLMAVIEKLYRDPELVALGEEVNKRPELPETMINRFYERTGKYPAVCGVDLACYGLQLPQINQSEFDKAVEQLSDFAHLGGIVTASSHWANPNGMTGDKALCRGNLGREDAWEELLTEGSELNTIWKSELLIDARFLKALCERGVPVLWRPLHEQNGGWFWFCIRQGVYTLPGKYMERVWRYVYNLYEKELGLTNLIWVYSPSMNNDISCDAMYCYPGDDVVDIVGYDWYTKGNYEVGHEAGFHKMLAETGKPVVIAEFGPKDILWMPADAGDGDEGGYWTARDTAEVLRRMHAEGKNVAFLMAWTAKSSIHALKYADELMSCPMAVDRDRLAAMFDEMN